MPKINNTNDLYSGMLLLKDRLKNMEDNLAGIADVVLRAQYQSWINQAQLVLTAWDTDLTV